MNKNFGLTDSQIKTVKLLLAEGLLRHAKTYKVFVFGSRVHGTEKKYSDLDLWIESDPELTFENKATFLETVESSDLPIKIDLLTERSCLDSYRDRIFRERAEWFALD